MIFRLRLCGAAISAAAILLAISLAAPPARAEPAAGVRALPDVPVATDARVGGDDKQVRLIVDLSRKVELATFTLADPYRVVIDLPQITFKLPDKAGEHGRGLIHAFRYGLVMAGGSRIVIDTKGPVRVDKAFSLAAAGGQPARLVVELSATDRDSFLRNIAVANQANREINAKRSLPPRPAIAAAGDDKRPLIVLDPGHGGIDNGTKAKSGELEKDMVLAFAKVLQAALEKDGKYRVAMTRSDDTYVPLGERVKIARAQQAALFISIHADFLPRGEGQADGASIYTLSEHASDKEAERLADEENKADVIAGVDLAAEPSDVANILVDLAQRETKAFSAQFARTAFGEMKTATTMHKHPVKAAGFKVLTAPDVPSVLIELGYMSDKGDLKHLTSLAWREKTAAAIKQAIDTFFAPRLAGTTGAR